MWLKKIKSENLAYDEIDKLMDNTYIESSLAQKIFEDIGIYKQRVMACLANKEPPAGVTVEELPIENITFDTTPYHNLPQLYTEVEEEMFGGPYEGISGIGWTDKPYKSYFGMYMGQNGFIRINKLLDSKDVPAEVIKYLIYHEMLHRDHWHHDKTFREKEHQYPDYTEWDSFLDGKLNKFNLGEVFTW